MQKSWKEIIYKTDIIFYHRKATYMGKILENQHWA